LEKQLTEYFGFSSFLKGQREVIKLLLKGQSAAALFPTGAGKSLCYQLPALLLPGLTLVISPLLSLMKDQLDFLKSKNLPAAKLDSTMSREEYSDTLSRARSGSLKILMVSVERFKNERFRMNLERMEVSLLVVDEAHCISEWGHNFRPEYLKIPGYRNTFNINQVLLLTATATPKVLGDMCVKFNIPKENAVVTGFYRANLFLKVSPTAESEKDKVLVKRISEQPLDPTIVYVTLQKTAERVAGLLMSNGLSARAYHAGLKSDERKSTQDQFMAGEIPTVVATIAFGMGIDKRDIRRIIHFNLPKSIESYSQEIGRAGRDGKNSYCEVLANKDNISVLENFIYGDTPEETGIRGLLSFIKDNPSSSLEIRLYSLSLELNIRMLPLKTLLVYLEMSGILEPVYSYFEELPFKYLTEKETIIGEFDGERKKFIQSIFRYSKTAKIWTKPDIERIMETYGADRVRIIRALEYLDEKGLIELERHHTVEVYEILRQDFDINDTTNSLHSMVKVKETFEIKRIQQMLDFFMSDTCLSRELSNYFGEHTSQKCGHCSVCTHGKAELQSTVEHPPLSEFNFDKITVNLLEKIDFSPTPTTVTRFLCGVNCPFGAKFKLKELEEFGILKEYPYGSVNEWVVRNI
jgi:ATP-dependent DNA helicase RecQ